MMLLWVLLVTGAGAGAVAQSDTLTAGVCEWDTAKVSSIGHQETRKMLRGATHDLSLLDIHSVTLNTDQNFSTNVDDADDLLIMKEGELTITAGDITKQLGPGGIALLPAGQVYHLAYKGPPAATWYLFRFVSQLREDRSRAQQPFLLDWPEMTMKKTDKGESRQIFSQPTPWLTKIDMHATTLNPGEVSHLPHIHRAEEIILMRSGHVQMYINGQHYPAAGGDLVFLASGNPHALENKSTERCEYFALQWQQ